MHVGDDVLKFGYDASGSPMYLQFNNSRYFYATNVQGDVTALVHTSGTAVVEYTYDAWGNILTTTGSMASTLGQINPLRYRGYVYDAETGLYYLQSRYYDPAIGRFITSDVAVSTGQGLTGNNMYAYCGNNPVNRADSSGTAWETVWDLISLGYSIAEVAVNPRDLGAWLGLAGDFVDVAIPFVGGIGETARAMNAVGDAVDAVDDLHDTSKAVDRIDDATDAVNAFSEAACFVAGTEILSQNGAIPIECVSPGDLVWAWDENTDSVALKKVVETYINETDELIYIFVNGEKIITTPSHPFYSPVKGWTDAVHLRAGDVLVLVNGEYVVVEKVQHEILEAPVTVYNFQVEDYHTYYVSDIGILVHNSCAQPFRFDENQQVVLDLAQEYKDGMTRSDANILVDWAQEYGIKSHYPGVHERRSGIWSYTEHINIRGLHIRIIEQT